MRYPPFTPSNMQKSYKVIATKISPAMMLKIEGIAEELNLTRYELIQGLLSGFVRMHDPGAPIGDEVRNLMRSITFNASTDDKVVSLSWEPGEIEKVVVFRRGDNGHEQKVTTLSLEHGQWVESLNFDEAAKAILSGINHQLPDIVTGAQNQLRGASFVYTLYKLLKVAHEATAPTMSDEVKDLFSDIRLASGHKLNVDNVHYKRARGVGQNITQVPQLHLQADSQLFSR